MCRSNDAEERISTSQNFRINKRKMTKSEKKEHYVCINESKNVTAHAKCVVRVYEQLHKRNEKLKMYSTLTTRGRWPRIPIQKLVTLQ